MSSGARNADFRYVHRSKHVDHGVVHAHPAIVTRREYPTYCCGYQQCTVGHSDSFARNFAWNSWACMVAVCADRSIGTPNITLYRRENKLIISVDKREFDADCFAWSVRWSDISTLGLPETGTPGLYDLTKLSEVSAKLHRQKRLYLQTIRRTV